MEDYECLLILGVDVGVFREVFVDINLDDLFLEERKKKDRDERQNVIDVVKSVVVGKLWLRKQDVQEGMV